MRNIELIHYHNKWPPTPSNYSCALQIQSAKSSLFNFRRLMISIIELSSIPFSQYIQCLNLNIAMILHVSFSLIDM